ncbi:hypothetical protein CDAR_318471 [Caerostris darwini]|uniref:Activating transcription factor 7-interacting protein Fn3 domain-containing protein n=1 Tax=Caerostris darwini TaxID=1538125 RepID=A0AAV4Q4D5_9ARAC|nr:hypothetical protein CDAR_318471 [Caerostris darwini]
MEVEDGSLKPMKIRLQPINENLNQMIVEGISDDESEEYVEMTSKEMHDYMRKKILEYSKTPEGNPLVELEQQELELMTEIKAKNENIKELKKKSGILLEVREKVLRHIGVLPKITQSIGVSSDLSISSKASNPLSSAQNNQIHSSIVPVKQSRENGPANRSVHSSQQTKSHKFIDYIDLSDESESSESDIQMEHPAPFPAFFYARPSKDFRDIPVKPSVKVCVTEKDILLSWNIPSVSSFNYLHVESFELFRYQVASNVLPSSLFWRQIGIMKAQPLPMQCNYPSLSETTLINNAKSNS